MPAGRPRLDQQLSHCREEGVTCNECIQRTAGSIQRICADVTASFARQIFLDLFPEPACSRMSGSFVQAVLAGQANEPARIPRRMPGRETPGGESPVRKMPALAASAVA